MQFQISCRQLLHCKSLQITLSLSSLFENLTTPVKASIMVGFSWFFIYFTLLWLLWRLDQWPTNNTDCPYSGSDYPSNHDCIQLPLFMNHELKFWLEPSICHIFQPHNHSLDYIFSSFTVEEWIEQNITTKEKLIKEKKRKKHNTSNEASKLSF